MTINWDQKFRNSEAGFGGEVLPNKITPMTVDQAAKALSDGYKKVTGSRPNKLVLGLLVAQSALETGNWASIHNYNFGNFKASSSDKYIQYFGCNEGYGANSVNYPAGDPHCIFAAYVTAADGAAAFIKGLKNRQHWWNGLMTKTVAGFIKGLTTPPAFFTGNPVAYSNIMEQRLLTYQPIANKYAANWASSLIGLAIGGGLWYGYNRMKS